MAGKQFTGIDGALYADGARVGKVQQWSFQASAAALDCTTLGDFASRYVYGIQSFTGALTLLYYEQDGGSIDGGSLLTDAVRTTQTPTEPTHTLELRYEKGAKLHAVSFLCLLNQVSISAQAGEIITAQVTFTASGPLTTATLD